MLMHGFKLGPALECYPCFKLIDAKTMATVIDTLEFLQSYLMQPSVMPEDRIMQHQSSQLPINSKPLMNCISFSKIDKIAHLLASFLVCTYCCATTKGKGY